MISNKALVFLGASMLLSMTIFTGYQYVFEANFQVEKIDKRVCIDPDTDFNELLKSFTGQGIVHEPLSFAFISKLMNYQDHIKPGCYLIKKNMSNLEAIRMLRSGDQIPEKLTFSNARFIEDLAGDLTRNTLADSTVMASKLQDPAIALKYGFKPETFISMFLPNTYYVFWTHTEDQILDRLKQEYDGFWTQERIALAKEQGLTPVEASTLASIVMSESLSKAEQPKIAGLYLNRLRQGIRLEADPTVKFALGDFSIKRILYGHLEVASPYNTYRNLGLPPGPISMPTISSIDAVLNPESHDYIFMCSIGDGTELHNFAKTNAEHNRNRQIYDKNLKARAKR